MTDCSQRFLREIAVREADDFLLQGFSNWTFCQLIFCVFVKESEKHEKKQIVIILQYYY